MHDENDRVNRFVWRRVRGDSLRHLCDGRFTDGEPALWTTGQYINCKTTSNKHTTSMRGRPNAASLLELGQQLAGHGENERAPQKHCTQIAIRVLVCESDVLCRPRALGF